MQQYFSHICDGTDVQEGRRRCTYGGAPNAIDISHGSLTCPSYIDTGPLFIRWFRHTAPFSRLLRHTGDTEDVFSTLTPWRPHGETSIKGRKRRLMGGGVSESPYKKVGPVSVLGWARLRTLRNVYGVGSPTVGPTSSVRLHIYDWNIV